MGIVICAQHGRQPIVSVCPHVWRAIRHGHPPPELSVAVADYEGLYFHISMRHTCADSAASDGAGLTREGESGLDWIFTLESEPLCRLCFDEAGHRSAVV
jgi:hypothetical protein